MKPRKPIKRKTPLKRSTKPIKRSPIRRRKTKVETERLKANPYSIWWRDKADDQMRIYTRLRAGNRCEKCGRGAKKLDTHHLINRSRLVTRNDPRNTMLLCSGHHTMYRGAPHNMKDSFMFAGWLQQNHPDKWEYMQKHKNDQGRVDHKEAHDHLVKLISEFK